jgi:hypothetical protein
MSTVYQIEYWNFEKEEAKGFHVFAHNFDEAKDAAEIYIDDTIEEGDSYDILSITMLPDINIVNALEDAFEGEHPPYEGTGTCPYCLYEISAPEMQMAFNCPNCNEELKVSDNDWQKIFCTKCYHPIERSELYKDGDGKWVFKGLEIGA